jgi:lipoate-protein ligase A
MDKLKVFSAEHNDPWFNLATEDWIFNNFEEGTHVLFLWRNKPCIVIGRFQNPWVECNLQAMEQDKVVLARRQSGGGAVYHDLGNTNFTFMSQRSEYEIKRNFKIITDALKKFDIEAQQSGRNDILVDGRKISGSAFRMTTKKAFHHGTLLINANMGMIGHYLTPDKEKLQSKGVRSVASRVANLTEFNPLISHENLCDAIVETFFETYKQKTEIEHLTIEKLSKEESLYKTYQQYSDWSWRFGTTPQFSHKIEKRFDWGKVDINLDVQKSVINQVKIFSDSLSVEFIELLHSSLENIKYDLTTIKESLLKNAASGDNTIKEMVNDVIELIEKEFA